MITEDYKRGFVEQCIESGMNKQDTEELFKIAFYASNFDNDDFKEGFLSQTVPMNLEELPIMAKAELVKRVAHDDYEA